MFLVGPTLILPGLKEPGPGLPSEVRASVTSASRAGTLSPLCHQPPPPAGSRWCRLVEGLDEGVAVCAVLLPGASRGLPPAPGGHDRPLDWAPGTGSPGWPKLRGSAGPPGLFSPALACCPGRGRGEVEAPSGKGATAGRGATAVRCTFRAVTTFEPPSRCRGAARGGTGSRPFPRGPPAPVRSPPLPA